MTFDQSEAIKLLARSYLLYVTVQYHEGEYSVTILGEQFSGVTKALKFLVEHEE